MSESDMEKLSALDLENEIYETLYKLRDDTRDTMDAIRSPDDKKNAAKICYWVAETRIAAGAVELLQEKIAPARDKTMRKILESVITDAQATIDCQMDRTSWLVETRNNFNAALALTNPDERKLNG